MARSKPLVKIATILVETSFCKIKWESVRLEIVCTRVRNLILKNQKQRAHVDPLISRYLHAYIQPGIVNAKLLHSLRLQQTDCQLVV